MGGNQFHFHCVWFGENRGDWKLPPGGGGGGGGGGVRGLERQKLERKLC